MPSIRSLILSAIVAHISVIPLSAQVDTEIVLATTTSVRDTGLLDALLRRFRESSEYRVKVIAVGSGQAMELGRRGEADILILHDPDGERQFVRRGYGARRDPLMHNEFVIVGPPEDPAGLRGLSPVAAVRSVATACRGDAPTCLFVSRADRSGTHTKEQALWRRAAITPDRLWYRESGQGMSATLQIANELSAYVLTDIGTLLSHRSPLDLPVLIQGDTALHNPYHVVTVNAERFPWINTVGAEVLREFLLSRRAQDLISAFGRTEFGRALFRPGRTAGDGGRRREAESGSGNWLSS